MNETYISYDGWSQLCWYPKISCVKYTSSYILLIKRKNKTKKSWGPNLTQIYQEFFVVILLALHFVFFLIRIHFKQKSRIELKKKGQKSIQYGTSYINYSCMQCTIFQLEKGNNSLILFTCTVHASIVKSKNQFN